MKVRDRSSVERATVGEEFDCLEKHISLLLKSKREFMVRGCGPQPLVRFLRFTLGDSVFSSSRKSVIRLVWLLNESPGICLALLLQYVPPHPAPHMGDRVKLRSLCLHTCNFTQEGEAGLGYSAGLLP